MGTVSIGRNLIIRQLLLTGLVIALGVVAYMAVGDIETVAQAALADPKTSADLASAVAAAADTAAFHILIATSVAVLLMVVASALIIHSTIGRPMTAMAATVQALAAGDGLVTIAEEDRSDELGSMARGLRVIQEKLAAAETLAAVGVPDDTKAQRVHAVSGRVEKFSDEMGAHVRRLAAITKRLNEASGSMIVAARHASEGSDQATNASSNAAGDVSSVATASEQLLDSIEEISRQVVQSTSVVKAAVERAVETNAGMGRLSAAAQKVGDVVSLISRIAAQTNLLALNATIEAARAGEAGRGFAVVAQEVKTLATQTAKATQDITGQIAEMQEATELSVEAIDKIQRKISEVEHISTIIAAAVHEQGAATQEIARNVRSAAAGTATMSGHVENIVRSVDETSASASSVAALAREFDEIATTMTTMVNGIDGFARSLVAA